MSVQLFTLNGFSKTDLTRKEKVLTFISESKNLQTLYYNLKFSSKYVQIYSRNPINESVKQIQDFIQNIPSLEYSIKKVETLSKSIQKECYKFKKISLYILFVYCYEFETDNVKAYPIFKLNSNYHLNCIFIDWNIQKYTSWTNFLENNNFPLGLICTPKDGNYIMKNDLLYLEYFSTKPAQKKQLQCKQFSLVVYTDKITIWLDQIYKYLSALPEKIVCHFSKLWSLIKPLENHAKLGGVVFFKIILILLKYKNMKNLNVFWTEITSDITSVIHNSNNFDEEIKKIQDFFDNVKSIHIQFQKAIEQKDPSIWKDLIKLIMDTMEPLCEVAISILSFYSEKSTLMFVCLKILQYFLGPGKEILFMNQLESHDKYLCPRDYEYNSESLVKEMRNDFLEVTKKNEITEQNVQFEKKGVMIYSASLHELKKPNCEFFVLEQNTFEDVTKELKKILGSNFKLSIRETSYFEVTDSNDCHLGEVFYKNNVVMVLLKHEALINKDSIFQ